MSFVLKVLYLDTLVTSCTPPVVSSCPVASVVIALSFAWAGQWEEGTNLAGHITIVIIILVTLTSIAAPGSVVTIVKWLVVLSAGAITIMTSAIVTTLYTLTTIIRINTTATPISTKSVVNTDSDH